MIRTTAIVLLCGALAFLAVKYSNVNHSLSKMQNQDSVIAWCLYEQTGQKPLNCVNRSLVMMDVYEHPNN